MPLFVFVSGYFSKDVEKCRKNAFKDLFFLFILMNTLWALFSCIFKNTTYLKNIFEPGISLWYILALFVWRYFLKDLLKIKHILPISILVSFLVLFMVDLGTQMALNRVFIFLPYFLFGYFFKKDYILKIKQIPKFISILGLFIVFITIFIILQQNWLSFDFLFDIFGKTGSFTSLPSILITLGSNVILMPIICCVSIFTLSLISFKKNILTFIGSNTLPLYLSHPYVQILYEHFGHIFSFNNIYTNYAVTLLLSCMCIFFFSTKIYRSIFTKIINKIKSLVFIAEPRE